MAARRTPKGFHAENCCLPGVRCLDDSFRLLARADVYELTSLTTSDDYSEPLFYGLTDDDTVVFSQFGRT